jgi:hypothetical protein
LSFALKRAGRAKSCSRFSASLRFFVPFPELVVSGQILAARSISGVAGFVRACPDFSVWFTPPLPRRVFSPALFASVLARQVRPVAAAREFSHVKVSFLSPDFCFLLSDPFFSPVFVLVLAPVLSDFDAEAFGLPARSVALGLSLPLKLRFLLVFRVRHQEQFPSGRCLQIWFLPLRFPS